MKKIGLRLDRTRKPYQQKRLTDSLSRLPGTHVHNLLFRSRKFFRKLFDLLRQSWKAAELCVHLLELA
jgi:hypothetical protein